MNSYSMVKGQADPLIQQWQADHIESNQVFALNMSYEIGRVLFRAVLQLDANTEDSVRRRSTERRVTLEGLRFLFGLLYDACGRVPVDKYDYPVCRSHLAQMQHSVEAMLNGALIWHPDDKGAALAALDRGEVLTLEQLGEGLQDNRS